MVLHSVEQHGGSKPSFLAVISRLEPSALYRACRESVQIANLPSGLRNMNRCMEWGRPRVPILVATGGDENEGESGEPGRNPRPEWSAMTMEKIREKGLKRIKFWERETEENESAVDHGHGQDPEERGQHPPNTSSRPPPSKRRRQNHPMRETEGATDGPGTDGGAGDVGRIATNGDGSGAGGQDTTNEDQNDRQDSVGGHSGSLKVVDTRNATGGQEEKSNPALATNGDADGAGGRGVTISCQDDSQGTAGDNIEDLSGVGARSDQGGQEEKCNPALNPAREPGKRNEKEKEALGAIKRPRRQECTFGATDIRLKKVVKSGTKVPVTSEDGPRGNKPGTRRLDRDVRRTQSESIGAWILKTSPVQSPKPGPRGMRGDEGGGGGGGGNQEQEKEKEQQGKVGEKTKELKPPLDSTNGLSGGRNPG